MIEAKTLAGSPVVQPTFAKSKLITAFLHFRQWPCRGQGDNNISQLSALMRLCSRAWLPYRCASDIPAEPQPYQEASTHSTTARHGLILIIAYIRYLPNTFYTHSTLTRPIQYITHHPPTNPGLGSQRQHTLPRPPPPPTTSPQCLLPHHHPYASSSATKSTPQRPAPHPPLPNPP